MPELPYNALFRAPQGWQCPVCGRVYAPHVAECRAHRPTPVESVPTVGLPVVTSGTNTARRPLRTDDGYGWRKIDPDE